jgi:hypothetical protein
MRERMLWVGIGLLSLLLAAALGLATSKLTEAPVGLSAEPVSAGEALAPSPTATPDATREPRKRKADPTAAPQATAPPESNSGPGSSDDDEADDDSGQGRGRGRGRSDDDD